MTLIRRLFRYLKRDMRITEASFPQWIIDEWRFEKKRHGWGKSKS